MIIMMDLDSVSAKKVCESLGEGLRDVEKEADKWFLLSGFDN